jgi:cytochrome c-type biogenesis protein CcmH/NrfG
MLVAGFVLGAVVTFMVMKQAGIQAPQAVAPPSAPAAPQASSANPGQADFDPAQHEAMIAQFIEKAKSDPKDASSKVMLGNIYYDKGDFIGAIPWYEEALKLEPENSDVIVDLGVCYRENKQFQKALQLFDRALAVDPKKKQALFNKAVVYGVDLKDGAKAREILGLIEKDYPGDPMAAQLRGSLPKQ